MQFLDFITFAALHADIIVLDKFKKYTLQGKNTKHLNEQIAIEQNAQNILIKSTNVHF